jgi:uncharacterized protein YutE (UPF0331/DUF86 family)
VIRPDKVEGKLENLRGYVQKLTHLAFLPRKEFLSDFTKIESAKHLFQVSVECCIDVGNHIIASERFRSPKTYIETFEILAEQKIIADEFLPTARQMVQFRNRLVHLYWEVDTEVIYDILQKNLEDFETFTSQILKYLSAQQKG